MERLYSIEPFTDIEILKAKHYMSSDSELACDKKIAAYVESYLFKGMSTLQSYQESHKNLLKVKASNYHSEPEVVKELLRRLVHAKGEEIKKMPNSKYMKQVRGRYLELKGDIGCCPVEAYENCMSGDVPNDPCHNIIVLTKLLCFFEFLDKEKYVTTIERMISDQRKVLEVFIDGNMKKWNHKAKRMNAQIKKYKLREIKYY